MWTDVMVDLETTATDPEHGAIIQIAAMKFNYQFMEVNLETFDRCLAIPKGKYWEEETLKWWNKPDKVDTLHGIYARQEPADKVLNDFFEWIKPFRAVTFWSKPSHFDYAFLEAYFKRFNLPNPFSYRTANDMNSFIRGLYRGETVPNYEYEIPFHGAVHNASDDVLHQIRVLFAHKDNAVNNNPFVKDAVNVDFNNPE